MKLKCQKHNLFFEGNEVSRIRFQEFVSINMYRDILYSIPGSGGDSLESNMVLAFELFISYWEAQTYKKIVSSTGESAK